MPFGIALDLFGDLCVFSGKMPQMALGGEVGGSDTIILP